MSESEVEAMAKTAYRAWQRHQRRLGKPRRFDLWLNLSEREQDGYRAMARAVLADRPKQRKEKR